MAETTKDVHLPKVGEVEVKSAFGWTNWKTLIANAGMAAAIPVLSFLSTVDWTQYVDPTYAVYFVIGVNVVLRFMTKGPAMSNVVVEAPK